MAGKHELLQFHTIAVIHVSDERTNKEIRGISKAIKKLEYDRMQGCLN